MSHISTHEAQLVGVSLVAMNIIIQMYYTNRAQAAEFTTQLFPYIYIVWTKLNQASKKVLIKIDNDKNDILRSTYLYSLAKLRV